MSRDITIKGIKYTLALTCVSAGFQVALAVINSLGYVNNAYPSVVDVYPTYGEAVDKYSKIYRYQTGKRL